MLSVRIGPPCISVECILYSPMQFSVKVSWNSSWNFLRNPSRNIPWIFWEFPKKFYLETSSRVSQNNYSLVSVSDCLGNYFNDCYRSSCTYVFLQTWFLQKYYQNFLSRVFFWISHGTLLEILKIVLLGFFPRILSKVAISGDFFCID